MPIRRIVVPEEVRILAPNGQPAVDVATGKPVLPITFRELVLNLLNHSAFASSGRALRAAVSIERAVVEVKPGDPLDVSDEDWQLLCRAVEEPATVGYSAYVLRRLVPMFDAILEAKVKE